MRQSLLALILVVAVPVATRDCKDTDMNCYTWVAKNHTQCEVPDSLVSKYCSKACQTCGDVIEPRYDLKRVPQALKPIAWLIGKWRSEFGGKAMFPTIPKFTYGEEVDISLSDFNGTGEPTLNYTASAWNANDMLELHQENGFLRVRHEDDTELDFVSLNTAMSNGFMTVEEGEIGEHQIRFKLRRIGRISFSHDSAVRVMYREWTLLNENEMEARLLMGTTVTRKLMEHTNVVYQKIYP